MKKKWVVGILMSALVLNLAIPAYAQAPLASEQLVMPRYVNIIRATSSIGINGNVATCSAYVSVRSKNNISITMELQKKNGNSWSTVNTWSDSFGNALYANYNQNASIQTGYSYRVKSIYIVGEDYQVSYSSAISA